jgi:hypothetical protein
LENQRMIRYLPTRFTRQQAIFLDVRKLVGGQKHLSGGFIGGYKEGLTRWIKEYYTVLHNANRDRFQRNDDDDEPCMVFETCIQNPGLCLWVEARDTYGDSWHYMAPFLHGVALYSPADHLRHLLLSSRIYLLVKWMMMMMMRERMDVSVLTTGWGEHETDKVQSALLLPEEIQKKTRRVS